MSICSSFTPTIIIVAPILSLLSFIAQVSLSSVHACAYHDRPLIKQHIREHFMKTPWLDADKIVLLPDVLLPDV